MDKTAFNQAYITGILKVAYATGGNEQDILRIAAAAGIEKEAFIGALARGAVGLGRSLWRAGKATYNAGARAGSRSLTKNVSSVGSRFAKEAPRTGNALKSTGNWIMNNPKKSIAAGMGASAVAGRMSAPTPPPPPPPEQRGFFGFYGTN